MRSAIVALLVVVGATSTSIAYEHRCEGHFCYQPQTSTTCVRPEVWGILNRLADRIGPLELTAGCNGRHARNSFHYRGMAMDFLPMKASQAVAMAALKSDPEVGGLIAEGRGLVHVDIGRRGEGQFVVWQTGGRRYAHVRRHGLVRVASR